MAETAQPPRRLKLEGAYNVRDLGGYTTHDGRQTRWRTLLRADELHRLAPASQAVLIDYGIRTVIDLRSTAELERYPSVFADSSQVAYHHQSLQGDVPMRDMPDFEATRDPVLVEMMDEIANSPAGDEVTRRLQAVTLRTLESYGSRLDRRQPQISDILATLAAPGGLPAMFNCAAGTDRTGIISALVLGIAGVPTEIIAEDYSLSAQGIFERDIADGAVRESLGGDSTWQRYRQEFCPPDAMLKVLGYLERRYGGVEGYVRKIGLGEGEIEALRSAMVTQTALEG